MDKEIIEGNKIIAEFDGWVLIPIEENLCIPTHYERGHDWWDLDHPFLYNESWDYLMPVVEKIESIHDDHHGYFGVHIISTKIKSTWYNVIQFINWYNTNLNHG